MGLQISSADGLRSVLPKYNIVWWLMEIRLVGSDQRDVFAKEIPFSPTSHPGSIRYVSTNHQSGADQELEAVVIYRSCPTMYPISLYMTHYSSSKRLKGMHEVCTKSLRITVVTQANKLGPKNQLYSRTTNATRRRVEIGICIREVANAWKYLGLPIMWVKAKRKMLDILKDRIIRKMNN